MKLIVGICGASGASMGLRLVEWLRAREEFDTHVILTSAARRIIEIETGSAPEVGAPLYEEGDFESPLASSSFRPDAMAILPCSLKTLAGLARAENSTLTMRAGDIMLRLRRPLVVAPRDTPLSLPAVENMAALLRAGAVVLPPVVAFYHEPHTLEDMVDFIVGKTLDAMGIDNDLFKRWRDA